MTEHYLDDSVVHHYFDNSYEPRLVIQPGDTVSFACREASDKQITPETTSEMLATRKRMPGHPLTGPVYVDGAQPGDVLAVEILNFAHQGWGWNSHSPNFGLLAEDFDFPYLQHWRLEGDECHFRESDAVTIPFEPFCGVMGVAPAEPGQHLTGPPAFHGGNMDIRGLVAGATLYLPVHVPGALFSTADCHAAQGDGEVSGTGIESPMTATLRFKLLKNLTMREPQFETPSPLTRTDNSGYYATTAHGPDLFVDSQNAVRYMIDWLEATKGMSRSQAYCLCSAAADLKISEIVDKPNWIVSCYMPLGIFNE
ncbi:MAG: acetamidase/formamidase family protein [Anaerolineales bacterium]|nr:acetamidase/formamidase family protein [Anaerolineales bacterium]MCB0012615.1 acetamidase/formamidase family protein [Anaerolineales bacterium]MCB0019832.1 acetamidase/formamidase family protein [Anaerolineales bacterium]MCB8963073.1 acetamidase/formamidase family protein [Ardenticatenales bacterium]